jgi:hypothetical protein
VKTWSAVLALAAAQIACHQGGDGGGGGGPQVSTAACEETAPLYCRQFFTCRPDDARFVHGTEQACAIDEAMACRILGTLPGTEALAIDHWGACNRALSTASCDGYLLGTPLSACAYLPGTRAVGQGCIDGRQCVSRYCKRLPARMESPSPDDRYLCGSCAPTPAAGDPCLAWEDCGHELACASGKCTALQNEGGACTLSDECDKLLCLEGKCSRWRMAGEPCTAFECASDVRCVGGTCAPGLDNGQPCTSAFECQSLSCGDDQLCKERTPRPAIEPGQPCTLEGPSFTSCRADSRCDESAHVCTPYTRAGEPCARTRECAYLLTCQAGKCQPITGSMCP